MKRLEANVLLDRNRLPFFDQFYVDPVFTHVDRVKCFVNLVEVHISIILLKGHLCCLAISDIDYEDVSAVCIGPEVRINRKLFIEAVERSRSLDGAFTTLVR